MNNRPLEKHVVIVKKNSSCIIAPKEGFKAMIGNLKIDAKEAFVNEYKNEINKNARRLIRNKMGSIMEN